MTVLREFSIPKPRTELVALADGDLTEVAQFIARQSNKDQLQVESHLRWFWVENPAREAETPMGWGLRAAQGQLVGCFLCIPQAFRFQHKRLLVMGSSCFYVDDAHLGSGALIFLKYTSLNKRWALFGNSANADAAKLWKGRGATPIPHSDHELLGIVRWSPVLEDVVFRKTGGPRTARLAGRLVSGLVSPFRQLDLDSGEPADLHPLSSAEQVSALPIFDPPSQLTSARDLPYIRWRYFSGRDPSVKLFAFRSKQIDRELLVAVNERPKGHRNQINSLCVLDVYPSAGTEVWLQIVSALKARYQGKIDLIVLRCLGPNRQKAFRNAGFMERKFEAPNGWFLDKRNLLPSHDWYLVPGDGDWVI
jgi:hypothetical protein